MTVEHWPPTRQKRPTCKNISLFINSICSQTLTFPKPSIHLLCLCSRLPPVEHQELRPEGHRPIQLDIADGGADWRLLRLLQSDLHHSGRPEPPGQRGQAEETRHGQGGNCDAGLLQSGQPWDPVHGLAGRADDAGEREPAGRLGGRPFTGQLQRSSHDFWDVQTVSERRRARGP